MKILQKIKEWKLNRPESQCSKKKLAIAGGVASNGAFRAKMIERCKAAGIEFYYPSPIFCTDNAAMIGVCGYYDYMNGVRSGLDLNAVPGLKIGTRQG